MRRKKTDNSAGKKTASDKLSPRFNINDSAD